MSQLSVISDAKYAGMITVGYMSACLSILGSSAIICFARKKLHFVYHRLILECVQRCLLVYRNVTSMDLIKRPLPWASGTDASCSAIGFVYTIFTLAVPLMNFFLSFYFMLAVKYCVSEQSFARHWERGFYLLGLFVPLTFAAAALKVDDIHTHEILLVSTLVERYSGTYLTQ